MRRRKGRPISVRHLTGDEQRDLIITLRRRLSLSHRGLAEKLEVSTSTVRMWENGSYRPSGPALKLLKMLEAETRHLPET